MNTRKALAREIAALERKLDQRAPSRRQVASPEEEVRAEIRRLEAMLDRSAGCGPSYMDDDMDSMGYMDDDMDSMEYMDDDMEYMDDEEDMDYMWASEEDPSGVEEEIDQDYLDDVEREQGVGGIADAPSMLDVAPTSQKAYVARLRSASTRLDRVAQYLEKQGKEKLAYRLCEIADAIDARREQEVRNG